MKVLNWFVLALMFGVSGFSNAAEEAMTQMPIIKVKRAYTVQTNEKGEDLQDQRGFGETEPMVRMMNLMMVEGSGYEGMDMGEGKMKMGAAPEMKHGHQMQMAAAEEKPSQTSEKSDSSYKFEATVVPNPPKVGVNVVTISIRDAKTSVPQKGLKLKAQVSMTSMDMGTDEPRVREVAPGKYQVKATFSMKGPWAVKVIMPNQEKVFNFDAGGGH